MNLLPSCSNVSSYWIANLNLIIMRFPLMDSWYFFLTCGNTKPPTTHSDGQTDTLSLDIQVTGSLREILINTIAVWKLNMTLILVFGCIYKMLSERNCSHAPVNTVRKHSTFAWLMRLLYLSMFQAALHDLSGNGSFQSSLAISDLGYLPHPLHLCWYFLGSSCSESCK